MARHKLGSMKYERFSTAPTVERRAVQIWSILIAAAHNRQILTYKIVSTILGYRGSGVLDRQLGHIMYFCHYTKLPPLTVLVVNETKGSPGGGLMLKRTENAERERVYKEKWFEVVPPTVAQLANAWAKGRAEFSDD